MSRVYESLKVIVQDTVQRGKTNSMPLPRVKSDRALTLNDEMDELERIVADRIGRLKAAVREGEAVVAAEAQHAEQLVESLKGSIGALEAKFKETEETVRRKDLSRHQMEESLVAKIHDLENDVKKKEEVLASQANEINDLKSNIDGQVKQVAELELALDKAKIEAASHAKRAEDLTESSQAKIAALESHLRETEELARQNLTAKVQDLESQVRNKEEFLACRDAEINDLKSQLKALTKGIREMSSLFRQAEALAAIERQDVSKAVLNEPVSGWETRSVTGQSKLPKVTPIVLDVARKDVSPDVLECITVELAKVANVIKPLASIIVREHVVALGESMENFPKTRLPELLESLAKEISDEELKIDFRKWLAQNTQIVGESGVLS